jgi:hypothetical protein
MASALHLSSNVLENKKLPSVTAVHNITFRPRWQSFSCLFFAVLGRYSFFLCFFFRLGLLHDFQIDFNLYLVANQDTARFQRLVPGQAERFAIDFG